MGRSADRVNTRNPNPTNPIGCGVDIDDDRCIDSGASRFCRVAPRVLACCGDALCEGEETEASCANDCAACTPTGSTEVACSDGLDNDCDLFTDCDDSDCALDPACIDTDGDGIIDAADNCPTIANGPAQAGVPGVGNQTNSDSDPQGDACNPRIFFDNSVAGGLVDTNGDLIPDVCQCGDAKVDGLLGFDDATNAAQAFVGGIPTYALTCPARPEGTPVP